MLLKTSVLVHKLEEAISDNLRILFEYYFSYCNKEENLS